MRSGRRFGYLVLSGVLALTQSVSASVSVPAAPLEAPAENDKSVRDRISDAGDVRSDEQVRQRSKAKMWNSTLGQMFGKYLEYDADTRDTNRQAHEIVERVYSDLGWNVPRSTAINLMITDLYEQDHVNDTVRDRILLLQSILDIKQNELKGRSFHRLLNWAPAFAAVSLAIASPAIAKESAEITRMAYEATVLKLYRVTNAAALHQQIARTPIAKLMAPLFKGYKISTAINTFVASFTLFSLAYALVRTGSTKDAPVVVQVGISELEMYVPLEQL